MGFLESRIIFMKTISVIFNKVLKNVQIGVDNMRIVYSPSMHFSQFTPLSHTPMQGRNFAWGQEWWLCGEKKSIFLRWMRGGHPHTSPRIILSGKALPGSVRRGSIPILRQMKRWPSSCRPKKHFKSNLPESTASSLWEHKVSNQWDQWCRDQGVQLVHHYGEAGPGAQSVYPYGEPGPGCPVTSPLRRQK